MRRREAAGEEDSMVDNIKFDFLKAQNALRAISRCNESLKSLAIGIGKDAGAIGTWWRGESYIDYRDVFTCIGGGKSIIEGVAEDTSQMSAYLTKAAQMKRDWEQKGKRYFC